MDKLIPGTDEKATGLKGYEVTVQIPANATHNEEDMLKVVTVLKQIQGIQIHVFGWYTYPGKWIRMTSEEIPGVVS